MDRDIQIWNQYENLRNEIIKADSINYQIIGIVVAAVAAIITASFNRNDLIDRYIILLCVYMITFPSKLLLIGNRIRIWRITTYIRVFLEPELEYIRWESRLSILAEKHKGDSLISSYVVTNEFIIITMLNLIAGLISIYVIYQINRPFNLKIGLATIVLMINLIFIIYTRNKEQVLKRNGKVERDFIQSWEQLKNLGTNK